MKKQNQIRKMPCQTGALLSLLWMLGWGCGSNSANQPSTRVVIPDPPARVCTGNVDLYVNREDLGTVSRNGGPETLFEPYDGHRDLTFAPIHTVVIFDKFVDDENQSIKRTVTLEFSLTSETNVYELVSPGSTLVEELLSPSGGVQKKLFELNEATGSFSLSDDQTDKNNCWWQSGILNATFSQQEGTETREFRDALYVVILHYIDDVAIP